MTGAQATLFVDLAPGERLDVGGPARIEFVHKSGRVVRLRVCAAREVSIKKGAGPDETAMSSRSFVPRLAE